MPDKLSTNERPALECASVTWKFGPIRIESLRLSKFLQVGARAALHLRRTGNTAEWKTIACRAGAELLQGGGKEGAAGEQLRSIVG